MTEVMIVFLQQAVFFLRAMSNKVVFSQFHKHTHTGVFAVPVTYKKYTSLIHLSFKHSCVQTAGLRS